MSSSSCSSAAPKLRHISTTMVRPSSPTNSTQTLELTPWDLKLLVVHPIQKGLLFRQPNHPNWLANLKTSFSLALTHFFPFAGRIATRSHSEDNTISLFIQCNDAGAEFVHAAADLTISDIINPLYVPPVVYDFFPFNHTINYDHGRSQPLLGVQVTELTDGVFVGLTANHVVADGTTFWDFINSWSQICKTGSDEIQFTPTFTRSFFPDLPIRYPASIIEKSLRPYSLPPIQERRLYFAPQCVTRLKQKANLENNNNPNRLISSLQAVLAHVWRGVVRARNLEPDQPVNYLLLVGIRGRLDPPLPKGYFGNSVDVKVATTSSGELLNGGLGYAAGLLNKAVGAHTSASIWSDWEKWVKEPNFVGFDQLKIDNLVTGSSPRFNMYGNNFGWGCPIAVRSGCGNKYNGKLSVFPGAIEGSMEIEACLSTEILTRMGENSEFMQFIRTLEDDSVS